MLETRALAVDCVLQPLLDLDSFCQRPLRGSLKDRQHQNLFAWWLARNKEKRNLFMDSTVMFARPDAIFGVFFLPVGAHSCFLAFATGPSNPAGAGDLDYQELGPFQPQEAEGGLSGPSNDPKLRTRRLHGGTSRSFHTR